MSHHDNREHRRHAGDDADFGKKKKSVWLYVGVGVLIVLLLVWMTIASFWEDTDVAALITPII